MRSESCGLRFAIRNGLGLMGRVGRWTCAHLVQLTAFAFGVVLVVVCAVAGVGPWEGGLLVDWWVAEGFELRTGLLALVQRHWNGERGCNECG